MCIFTLRLSYYYRFAVIQRSQITFCIALRVHKSLANITFKLERGRYVGGIVFFCAIAWLKINIIQHKQTRHATPNLTGTKNVQRSRGSKKAAQRARASTSVLCSHKQFFYFFFFNVMQHHILIKKKAYTALMYLQREKNSKTSV